MPAKYADMLPRDDENGENYLSRIQASLKTHTPKEERLLLMACEMIALGWVKLDMTNPFHSPDGKGSKSDFNDMSRISIVDMSHKIKDNIDALDGLAKPDEEIAEMITLKGPNLSGTRAAGLIASSVKRYAKHELEIKIKQRITGVYHDMQGGLMETIKMFKEGEIAGSVDQEQSAREKDLSDAISDKFKEFKDLRKRYMNPDKKNNK